MPTIVFDFDNTLTKKDAVVGFLLAVSNKRFKAIRVLFLIFFAILHKLRLINNDRLKKAGIALFLEGLTKAEMAKRSADYAATIAMNDIYRREFCGKYPKAIIATASFEDYVKVIFKENLVLAARVSYTDDRVSGLEKNAYGPQKVKLLNEQGIKEVDIFYTDSFSDQALMDISAVVYLVKNNDIKKIKG